MFIFIVDWKFFSGINAIKEGIGDKMGILIAYIVNSISCLIIAFCYSWKITLVMIGFLPLLAGLVGLLAQVGNKAYI
uniref:ABC transmembrane type-1 domain-containing protein n=1 Tax=Ascaris lumbricoides TaxID=6252 RepID=A0A0M3HKC8_ASCLU